MAAALPQMAPRGGDRRAGLLVVASLEGSGLNGRMRPLVNALAIVGVVLAIAAVYQHVTEQHAATTPRGVNGVLGTLYEHGGSSSGSGPHVYWAPNSPHSREALALLSRVMAKLQASGRYANYDNARYSCTWAGGVMTCSLTKKGEPTVSASGTS